MAFMRTECVFDYPVPSPMRIFSVENGCVRLSEVCLYRHLPSSLLFITVNLIIVV